ncbi:MAG: DUF6797 domain-containing protein, partial [Pirellula sp.]
MKIQDRFRTHLVNCSIVATLIAIGGLLIAANPLPARAQAVSDEQPFSQARVNQLVDRAAMHGDFDRGLHVYTLAKAACFSCHRIGDAGGVIGPELIAIAKQRTAAQLAESLLWPNRLIAPEYQPHKIVTDDGTQIVGYVSITDSNNTVLTVRDPATQAITKIDRKDIEIEAKGLSLMPNGLVDSLSPQEQADLLSFLIGLSSRQVLDLQAIAAKVRSATTHEPATFEFERGPLRPDLRLAAKEPINRDRIYDFYSKQAIHFSKQTPQPKLMAQFPGLDGPAFGHWGNQNEEFWKGDEMNQSVHGLVQCGVLNTSNRIPRAICFQIGPDRDRSACFNPDSFAYEKLWTGNFIKYSDVRHGLMDGIQIAGTEIAISADMRSVRELLPELSKADIQFRGYYVNVDQVLFCYEANGKQYIDALIADNGVIKRAVGGRESHPMRGLLTGGQKQWPQSMETEVQLGTGKGLVIDTIRLPIHNPWRTLLYCGDHAFLKDGSAIIATVQGDVWRVKSFAWNEAKNNTKAQWTRIASGLYQALGVVVHDEQIYVLGRNQITRLKDLNGDGETDYYECYSNAFKTSPGGHDYICGLQRDSHGNFYLASGNQGLVQISKEGQEAKVIGTGFRNPDGFGLLPDGTLTVPASEGDWTPASMIYQVIPKAVSPTGPRFDSTPPPFFGHRGPKDWQKVELPLVYLPRGLDNSSGGQVWVDDKRLGPLDGQILHTSYGAGQAMLVLRDRVGDQWQGAVVPLPGEYRSGVHRARVNPADGCLYLSGMNGWGSYTPDSGCFQRLRFTGDAIQLPVGFHVHSNGIAVRFHQNIDPAFAKSSATHFAQCWNYRYSPGYGSKEYSVLHPPMIGHDRLAVASSHVLDNGKTLFLEIPELQKCSQLHLRLQLGQDDFHDLFASIHAMADDRSDFPGYQPTKPKTLLPHPMARDLEWLKRSVPNPWIKRLQESREVRISARDNLQFSTRTIDATAGERIKLVFSNPDVVPHNWALIRPGSLAKIGELTNKLV